MKDRAIVLSAFGTLTAAQETYTFFEEKLSKRFFEEEIFWAYSSKTIIEKMQKENVCLKSTQQVLKTLKQQGFNSAVFQSLHIVPGIEFEELKATAGKARLNNSVGLPLLSSEIDCYRTIDALSGSIPDPGECITVLAGHGTPHSKAGSMYLLFEDCVRKQYPENVYVSMVDGQPSWESALKKIKKSAVKKIKFIPLMFVAGEHIMSDVLGDHSSSWKNRLEGYEIDGAGKGLGFNSKIIDIYSDHLQGAIAKL